MNTENTCKTKPKTPLILDIKGNSLDDGPGIRTVVFFKGCPLSCVWCHNPESKKAVPEISFDKTKCVASDTCINVCSEDALDRKNPFFIDRNLCTLCEICVANCPSGAIAMVGKKITMKNIVATVLKDKPFYQNSGGGVTLSGGEPTLYMDFLSSLLAHLKSEGIHTLIETCRLFDLETFKEKILPFIDTIYYDIKIIDSLLHKRFCGVKNDVILENFIALNRVSTQNGIEILPRTPLIPDITVTEENLTAIADFLAAQGVKKTRLLAYNPLWHDKNEKIGIINKQTKAKNMTTWIPKDKIKYYESIFNDKGIVV